MRAVVLGAGVVGASVALAAKAAGFDVAVLAERRMTDENAVADPLFASAFPAASTIPHSVPGSDFLGLAKTSNAVFAALTDNPQSGVRLQKHFELWEDRPQEPSYIRALKNWRSIEDVPEGAPVRRPGAEAIYGYTFEMYFADMPVYAKMLDRAMMRAGIGFERRRLDETVLQGLEADIVFDCLGAGAASVFPDLPKGFLYRGILLKFACDGLFAERNTGEPVSYNYTPARDIYPAPDGGTWDVYFYPRETSIVLGGTRQQGQFDPMTGEFLGARYRGQSFEKNGVMVPSPILDLNRELIRQLTARELPKDFVALTGYRHVHGTAEEPRLAIEKRIAQDRCIIDCLGFGGAGVTLSWGSALRAVEIAREAAEQSTEEDMPDRLVRLLA